MTKETFVEKIVEMGFVEDSGKYECEIDTGMGYPEIELNDEETFTIMFSLYNPCSASEEEDTDVIYGQMVEDAKTVLTKTIGEEPVIDVSWFAEDADTTFSYTRKFDVDFVNKFISAEYEVDKFLTQKY